MDLRKLGFRGLLPLCLGIAIHGLSTPHAVAQSGENLLFILDASNSMWGQIDGVAKIQIAKEALGRLITDLPASTRPGLMAYGHRREGDCDDVETIYGFGEVSAAGIVERLEGITPRGKTPIARSLDASRELLSGANGPSSILLISDGVETCEGDPCAVAGELAALGAEVRVHVVGFDISEADRAALACIAEQGRGEYFTAQNASEFTQVLDQAVAVAQAEPTQAEPVVTAPTVSAPVFEDTFNDAALATHWRVENPQPELLQQVGDGVLFIAGVRGEDAVHSADAQNRLWLEQPLPGGDWDLHLDLSLAVQTGRESVALGVGEDHRNYVTAWLFSEWKGCGRSLTLRVERSSASDPEAEPEVVRFQRNLFDGPFADDICTGGRAYADALLAALESNGGRLSLSRRGRDLYASFQMQAPAFEAQPATELSFSTEVLTALRLPGQAFMLLGQWGNDNVEGESLYQVDHLRIRTAE